MKYLQQFKKLIIEQSRSLDKDVMHAAFLLLFCGVGVLCRLIWVIFVI